MINQFLLNGLVTGALYALGALGFALVYNTTRIFHIAYAALYVVGAYLAFVAASWASLPFPAAVLISMAGTAAISLLLDSLIYQPLERKKSSANVIMISSIGVMIVLINMVAMVFGNEVKVFSSRISDSFQVGSSMLTHNQGIQLLVCVVVLVSLLLGLKYLSFGLRTRAMRDDIQLLAVLGINITPLRRLLFAASGALVALVAGLVSIDVGLDPYVGLPFLLNVIVALIIGGLGNFVAPVLGGFLLALVQSVAVYFFEAKWESAVTFVILLVFLLFRPQGIMGETSRMV